MVKSAPGGVATTIDRIDGPRILLLCTANQCRSPMAEGILRDLLEQRGVAGSVGSAGLLDGGAPATATAVDVLGGWGIDLTGHRSRPITDDTVDLASADLVLTMERHHLREAVVGAPEIRDRTFTVIDFARRVASAPRRPDEDLRQWAERLGRGRPTSNGQGSGDDEVADPIGQSRARYVATATQLRDLLTTIVDQAWPSATRTDGVATP